MHQIEIERHVPAEMRDGTVLKADVYRPAGDGQWPVLVHRTPYGKAGAANWLMLDMVEAAERGYVVIHQDTRGRFESDGEWLPWAFEEADGHDTVVWAARLPYSNGRVGMFGGSYTGQTQWRAAIAQPEGLRSISPIVTWMDPENGLLFRGGAIELGLNTVWSLGQSFGQLPKVVPPEQLMDAFGALVKDVDEIAARTYWELPAAAQPAIVRTGLPDIGVRRAVSDPGTADEARVRGQHDRVQVPVLNIAGWFDVFLQGSLDNHVAMVEQGSISRLVVGPWNHYSVFGMDGGQTGQVNFGAAAAVPPHSMSMTDLELSWHDRWLKDDAPVAPGTQPVVSIFVMGLNQWRDEQEWPLARAVDTDLFLHADGSTSFDAPIADAEPSTFTYDPADPVTTLGGCLVMASEFPAGPADQAAVERRADVLVFTSEPLTDDLEVTGRLSASLFASTDGPSTDWVVRLCDVDEDGVSHNVADGIVRVSTTPGTVAEHEVDLWSTSNVFKAGHRVRVQVTSSCFPRWDRNLNTGADPLEATEIRVAQQQVFHDVSRPSRLTLPVVPALR